MKRKIIRSLFILFVFFSTGTVIATLRIHETSNELNRLIELHEIEDLRQNLVKGIQTAQSDLYAAHTSLEQNRDSILSNVKKLEQAAQQCLTCHHPPALTRSLEEMQSLVHVYRSAWDHYIEASPGRNGTDEPNLDAVAAIGAEIFSAADTMSVQASKNLEQMTSSAMEEIRGARTMIYLTIALTFLLGTVVAVWLAVSVTKPAQELVKATRAVASGNLGHTVSYSDKTEFGEIASSFNAMSVALKESYEKLTGEVTVRQQTEEMLLAQKQRLEDITGYVNCGLLLLDDQTRVIYANHVSEGWFGPFHQMKGRPVREVFQLNDPEKECAALEVLRTEGIANSEILMKAVHGEGKLFHVVASPVRNSNGRIHQITEVVVDITVRKKMEDELKESRERLRDLSHYLQEVREEERTHIAREVHEELGQKLTALQMDISWLNQKLPRDQASLIDRTESMTNNINDSLEKVKDISTKLRPSVLDHFGIAAAIEWQAKDFQDRTGIVCEVSIEPEDAILDRECSTTIFRVLQEALANVLKHARATRVSVRLQQDSDRVVLVINDNGKGLAKKHISSSSSFGLMGMRERVNAMKGKISFRGIDNQGTMIEVTIPLRA